MKTLLLFIGLSIIVLGESTPDTPPAIPVIPKNNHTNNTTDDSNSLASEHTILISSYALASAEIPHHSISDRDFKCDRINYIERDYNADRLKWRRKIGQTTHDTPTNLANHLINKTHKFVIILGERQSGKTVALQKIQRTLHIHHQAVEIWSVLLNLPETIPRKPQKNWQPEEIFSTALNPGEYRFLNNTILPEKPDKFYLLLDNIDQINFETMPRILQYIESLIKKGVRVVATKSQRNIFWSSPKIRKTVLIPRLTLSEIEKYLTEHWDIEFGSLTHYKHVDYAKSVVKFVKRMKICQNFGTIKRLKKLLSSDSINIFSKNENFIRVNDYVINTTFNSKDVEEMFENIHLPQHQPLKALSPTNGHVKKLFPSSSKLVSTISSPQTLEKLNSTVELGQIEKNKNLSSTQSPALNNDRTRVNEQLNGLKMSLKRDIVSGDMPSLKKNLAIIAETYEEFLTSTFCNNLLFLAIDEGNWRQLQPVILDLKNRCAIPSTVIIGNETLVHVALRKRDFELLKFIVEELKVPIKEVPGTKSLFITALDVNPLPLYSSPSFWKIMKYLIENGVVEVPQPRSVELDYSKVKPTAEDISSSFYQLFTDVSNNDNSNQTFAGSISWKEVDELSPGVREYRRNLVLTRGLNKFGGKICKDNTTLLEVLLKYRSIEGVNFNEEIAYRDCIYLALLKHDITRGQLTKEQEFRIGRALVESIGTLVDLKFVISFLSNPQVLSHFTPIALDIFISRLVERIYPEETFTKLLKRSLEAELSQTRAKYYSIDEPSRVIEELKRFRRTLQHAKTAYIQKQV